MDIISRLSSRFERYLTLESVHAWATYDYRARGMHGLPVFVTTMHRPKCAGGSWTYIALAGDANPAALRPGERLYVGSQTVDRMFRGDGMRGTNFHHAQMRAGRGSDTPEALLREGQAIEILRLNALEFARTMSGRCDLAGLQQLMHLPAKHPGYWLEQFILHHEQRQWRWNTAPAASEVSRLLTLLDRSKSTPMGTAFAQ